MIISPTVGRVLLYWPNPEDLSEPTPLVQYPAESGAKPQPFSAECVYVTNDRLVNIAASDHAGERFIRLDVPLMQPGDPVPTTDGGYCAWMEYQIGQAAKYEQERALRDAAGIAHHQAHHTQSPPAHLEAGDRAPEAVGEEFKNPGTDPGGADGSA